MSRTSLASLSFISLAFASGCASPTLIARASIEPLDGGNSKGTVFTNVNVFDGEQRLGARDVVVHAGVIAEVAPAGSIAPRAGQARIDGAGRTLMPGLVDAHAHLESSGEPIWAPGLPAVDDIAHAYLYAGVTTALVMQAGDDLFALRERARAGKLAAPHLYMAGPRITAPDGFPINLYRALLPWPLSAMLTASVLTAATPEEGRAHIDAMAHRLHPDFCKLTSDAFPPGTNAPTLSRQVLITAIERCEARGMRPTAHIGAPADILVAAEAGLALFAHPPTSDVFTDAQVARLAALGIPFVSTQRFLTGSNHMADGGTALDREIVGAQMLATFTQKPADFAYPGLPAGTDVDALLARYEANLRANVLKLHAAGVPVFVGTDSGSPGVVPGSSMQRELRMLVAAGIPILDVLRAATSAPADFLDESHSFGRIREGQRADLLLVTGDPTVDIDATAAIVAVFVDGRRVTRTRAP